MLNALEHGARSRRWSTRLRFLRRSSWRLNGKIFDDQRLWIRLGRVVIDRLWRRIRTGCWSQERSSTNHYVERFALLHCKIIQLNWCARTATLLPRYFGNLLLGALDSRAITPERLKFAPSIIALRLGGGIL
jgi:hypothetical protein